MPDYTNHLKSLMQNVEISSYKKLSKQAGVSEKQIKQFRQGKITQMQLKTLLKMAQTLQISLIDLLGNFGYGQPSETEQLRTEYQRLQMQMEQLQTNLLQEFQLNSLQVLESFLTYFPTAQSKIKENPQMEATKIIPLVQPVQKLIAQWGVTAIAEIGAEVPYNPQEHQLIESSAEIGEIVKVRYTGYKQGEKLLFRAKVSKV